MGRGYQRDFFLDVGRPVGRDKRQSVTVRRCGFSEDDDMTGERYG
jgi:hypothetical protein